MAENPEVLSCLDTIKDALVRIASGVYAAQEDGSISVMEGLALGVEASTSAMAIVNAVRSLSGTDAKEFLDVLKDSDLVMSEWAR